MNISKEGVVFSYGSDKVTFVWPWNSGLRVKSKNTGKSYISFREYLEDAAIHKQVKPLNEVLGLHKGKVFSISPDELLSRTVEDHFPDSSVVVIRDINPAAKDSNFWNTVSVAFVDVVKYEHIVFLVCKDFPQAVSLFESMTPDFAKASLFLKGHLIESNS